MALAPLRFEPFRRGGGRRVLFADDDPGMRTIVMMNLEAEGFEVALADDGDAALAEIDRLLPDLIVLDVMMPGRDGFEVLRALKAEPRTAGDPDRPADREGHRRRRLGRLAVGRRLLHDQAVRSRRARALRAAGARPGGGAA